MTSGEVQAPLAAIVMRMLRPLPAIQDPAAARGHISTFSPRQLATTVWGLSTLELHSGPLYETAAPHLMEHMRTASDKALSMVAGTYARPAVQERSRTALPVLRSVLASLRARIAHGSCIPDVIADTVWHAWRGCRAHQHLQAISPSGHSISLTADGSTPSIASTPSTAASQPETVEAVQSEGAAVAPFDRLVVAAAAKSDVAAGAEVQAAAVTSADLPAVRQALAAAVSALGECRPQVCMTTPPLPPTAGCVSHRPHRPAVGAARCASWYMWQMHELLHKQLWPRLSCFVYPGLSRPRDT